MSKNAKLRGISLFMAGFAVAMALAFTVFFAVQSSRADQYSCIRTALHAQDMSGNIPDPEFTITYNIPRCYAQNHYKVKRVYMYGDQVAVHYVETQQ